MKRVKARGEARKGHRNRRPWRLEMLESRLLLSGQGLDQEPLLHLDPAITLNAQASGVAAVETSLADSSSASAASSGGELAAATTASSSVPVLNSLPGAAISLYLDFDGDYESQWGSYGSVATPAFDQDGNPGSFNTSELATIREIWQYVAEDYAPFQVNVTTVEPTSFANGAAIRVAIGGDGAWLGGQYGGISYIDSFSNSMPNTVFVFAENLGNGNAKYVGDAASHEAGHAFGLVHQSEYDANGVKIEDYSTGPGDGRAPLMGDSYAATRSLWWNGTSGTSANSYQDDMAELGQTLRYRARRSQQHAPDGHLAGCVGRPVFRLGADQRDDRRRPLLLHHRGRPGEPHRGRAREGPEPRRQTPVAQRQWHGAGDGRSVE